MSTQKVRYSESSSKGGLIERAIRNSVSDTHSTYFDERLSAPISNFRSWAHALSSSYSGRTRPCDSTVRISKLVLDQNRVEELEISVFHEFQVSRYFL